ncbi:hypothetical protein FB451DRAFT_1179823 [Mycena latifolia]|nr:hypothetical protein FB451DRAFT_1179823 [Mycena latifolia]
MMNLNQRDEIRLQLQIPTILIVTILQQDILYLIDSIEPITGRSPVGLRQTGYGNLTLTGYCTITRWEAGHMGKLATWTITASLPIPCQLLSSDYAEGPLTVWCAGDAGFRCRSRDSLDPDPVPTTNNAQNFINSVSIRDVEGSFEPVNAWLSVVYLL